jgi:hypothetical protein
MSRSSPHADALNDDNAPGFASVPIYRRLITFDGWLIPFSVLVSFIPAQDRKDKKKFIHGTSETRKGSEFTEILPSDFSNPKSDSNARNKTFLSSLMMLSPPPLRLSLFNDIKLFVVVSFVFLFFPSSPGSVRRGREGSENIFTVLGVTMFCMTRAARFIDTIY